MIITLLVMYFPPEVGSASHLFYDFANELKRRGHEVNVITTFPRNYNIISDDKSPVKKYKRRLIVKECLNGLNVIRIRNLPIPRDSTILRGLEHFFVALSLTLGGIFAKSDIIIVYSPPLPLGLSGYILSKIKKSKLIVNIQDLYPQAAIDLGIISNPLIINLFFKMENYIYNVADHITVHSNGNKKLVSQKISEKKITVISNWSNETISDTKKTAEFKKEMNLEGNLIVTYAGIMSYSQDIDTILEAAILLRNEKGIRFLLVGGGPKKAEIENKIKFSKLDNITLLPYQSQETYSLLLQASDIGLVTLDADRVKTPVVPRKLNDITMAGKAVIANVPLNGDVANIIHEANCGFCIVPKNPKELAKVILNFHNNPELLYKMGYNGRCYAKENFSLEKCCSKYEKLFKDLFS